MSPGTRAPAARRRRAGRLTATKSSASSGSPPGCARWPVSLDEAVGIVQAGGHLVSALPSGSYLREIHEFGVADRKP